MSIRVRLAVASVLLLAAAPAAAQSVPSKDAAKAAAKATKDHVAKDHADKDHSVKPHAKDHAAKADAKDHVAKDHSMKAQAKDHTKDHATKDHAKDHAAKDRSMKEWEKDQDQPKVRADKMKDTKAAKEHASSGWAELDAYHTLMRNTWHTAEASNDLSALRARATDMAVSAKALAESTPPQKCNTPANRSLALSLAPATTDLAVAVRQGATDAQLKTALAALHDRFEKLEAGCSAPGTTHH